MLHSLARRVNKASFTSNVDRVEILDDGKLRVTEGFLPLVRANDLDSFDKIMVRAGGTMMRSVPGRSTVKIELCQPDGGTQFAFLKRYKPEYLSFWKKLLRFLHWPGSDDEAMHEWRMLHRLKEAGFPVAQSLSAGSETNWGVATRSFVMTAEVASVSADKYLATCPSPQRKLLACRVAELARRFHGEGFVHRDFYLAHVLVSPGTNDFHLFLLDLQRVNQPGVFGGRLRVKDLASLAYSALKAGASTTLLMRAFKAYLAKPKLGESDRRLFRRVQRRIRWLTRRRPRHDKDFVQLGERTNAGKTGG
jgi:Lipopolysaccharide kinase (Kdo/WaaP) family